MHSPCASADVRSHFDSGHPACLDKPILDPGSFQAAISENWKMGRGLCDAASARGCTLLGTSAQAPPFCTADHHEMPPLLECRPAPAPTVPSAGVWGCPNVLAASCLCAIDTSETLAPRPPTKSKHVRKMTEGARSFPFEALLDLVECFVHRTHGNRWRESGLLLAAQPSRSLPSVHVNPVWGHMDHKPTHKEFNGFPCHLRQPAKPRAPPKEPSQGCLTTKIISSSRELGLRCVLVLMKFEAKGFQSGRPRSRRRFSS